MATYAQGCISGTRGPAQGVRGPPLYQSSLLPLPNFQGVSRQFSTSLSAQLALS